MGGLKSMSRKLITAGAALVLFASGALLPRMQAVASAQSGGAGSAQSREVSVRSADCGAGLGASFGALQHAHCRAD